VTNKVKLTTHIEMDCTYVMSNLITGYENKHPHVHLTPTTFRNGMF